MGFNIGLMQMKILLIHHEIPYPIRSGWDKTIYNLIKILGTVHEVTLIAPVFRNTDPKAIEHIRAMCAQLITVSLDTPSTGRPASRWLYFRAFFL